MTLVSAARASWPGPSPELRVRPGPGTAVSRARAPGRLPVRIDADLLDEAVGKWLADQLEPVDELGALGLDGKSLYGSRTATAADPDCPRLVLLFDEEPVEKIRVPKLGSGRPRGKPDSVTADKVCSDGPCREYL